VPLEPTGKVILAALEIFTVVLLEWVVVVAVVAVLDLMQ
jgi:hypothetical protein